MQEYEVMNENTYKQGQEIAEKLWGARMVEMFESLGLEDDDFKKNTIGWFGMYFSRPGIDLKTRVLLCLGAATVLDKIGFIRAFILAAINLGCELLEIREAIIQVHLVGGFPPSRNGLIILDEVMREMETGKAVRGI